MDPMDPMDTLEPAVKVKLTATIWHPDDISGFLGVPVGFRKIAMARRGDRWELGAGSCFEPRSTDMAQWPVASPRL